MNSEVDLTKQYYQIWQKFAKVAKKCYQNWQKVAKLAKKCQTHTTYTGSHAPACVLA